MAETAARISLWGVEVFVAIAEEGSMSAAAKRVGASVSAVSQQVTNLEAALGTALVDRAARPLQLTPAGHTFLPRARNILNETQAARADLAGRDQAALTNLRLGMIEDFDADVTPRLLSEMARDLIQCRFLLETGASHHLIAQLAARSLDVVVAADTGAAAEWAEVHPLFDDPFVAVVPPGLARSGPPGAEALADIPFIHYTQRHHMGQQIAAHLARENLQPDHRFELDSYHAIMAMVADGAGWTIATPLGVLRAHRFLDRVTMVPLPMAPLTRTIALTARRGVLGEMPHRMAARLRPILTDLVVAPATARMPWLSAQMRVRAPG